MQSKLSSWCDGLIEAGWLAAIIVSPLFVNLHSSNFFEPGKVTLLRSIALLIVAALLIKFIDQQGWRSLKWAPKTGENPIWRVPFITPTILLALIYLVSTAFSVNRVISWTGSYNRMQGTYTILAYIVVFVSLITTIKTRQQVTRLVSTIIVTSIPISLYGIMQRLMLDPIAWIGADILPRVSSTLGNPIFLSAYLIMVIPLTLARVIGASTYIRGDKQIALVYIGRTLLYIFILIFQIVSLLWSGSRGPFLGFVIGIYTFILVFLVTLRNTKSGARRFSATDGRRALSLVFFGVILPFFMVTVVFSTILTPLLSYMLFLAATGVVVLVILFKAFSTRGWYWLWLAWILLAVVLTSLYGLFNVSGEMSKVYVHLPIVGNMTKTMAAWRDLPQIGRFGRLLESDQSQGRVRVLIWEGVIDLIQPHKPLEPPDGEPDQFNVLRPIIGYGPESMFVTFNRYYQPELAMLERRSASPDRAHNETLDAIAITGVAGVLLWQLLYISVFYYGFRWLGIVRSRGDRKVFFGLWIGGGLFGGVLVTSLFGISFLGVAIPFGTIVGIVIYLAYYSLVARVADNGGDTKPFGMNQILMIALVSAVLAHYVEVQLGIAITATRTYFFVYLALMFCIGYLLPKQNISSEGKKNENNLRGEHFSWYRSTETDSWVGTVLSSASILALIIGVLVYNFVLFQSFGGRVMSMIEEVPSVGEIINQSFFVNVNQDYAASPYLFLMLIATWLLGSLVFLNDLMKGGKIGYTFTSSKGLPIRLRLAALIFLAMLLILAIGRFLLLLHDATRLVGLIVLPIWAVLSSWAAIRILLKHSSAKPEAGIVATIGIMMALPVLFAGTIFDGIVIFIGCVAILCLIWDQEWNNLLLPVLVLALTSFGLGFLYATYHAYLIRTDILPSSAITVSMSVIQQRILELNQTISLITNFYIFAVVLLGVIGLTIAWARIKNQANLGSIRGFVAAIFSIPIAFLFIWTTNLQVTQADMAFRRAELWSRPARESGELRFWDHAIAAYQRAIELAPAEETYHQALGEAYLGRSALAARPDDQETLLMAAERQLLQARDINPLNTDHTANLARLNAYWARISTAEQREQRISLASNYYDAALSLSPKNSQIINEYARLAYDLQNDCQKALALYDYSVEVDPFYSETYIDREEIYLACGDQRQEEDK